jgi:hypothetical protein
MSQWQPQQQWRPPQFPPGRRAGAIAGVIALIMVIAACSGPGGGKAATAVSPASAPVSATATSPAVMTTDPGGGTCPITALSADGYCPGTTDKMATDPLGASCLESEMSGGLCPDSAPADSPATTAAAATVTYKVTGSYADVTYGPAGSNLQGHVPLRKTARIGNAAYYAVTAQLQGGGSVTCEILVDGAVISKATATGSYNIAMCEISQDPLSGEWTDTNAA